VWRVVDEVIENLEGVEDAALQALATDQDGAADGGPAPAGVKVVSVAAEDTADMVVLKMRGQLLPAGWHWGPIAGAESPLEVADRVAELDPKAVILSHLPPEGLNQARYLVRRLRARLEAPPLVVGRWGESGGAAAAAERLTGVGATHVVFTL